MYKLFIAKGLSTKEILKRYHLDYEIIYNEYGKPYFKNNPIFFNVSHSRNITVLCLSNHEVGVDIQALTYRPKIIDRICTLEEKRFIHNEYDFTKIWVKKESYVKMLGQGIGYGLKKVDTSKVNNIKIKKYKNFYIAICLK